MCPGLVRIQSITLGGIFIKACGCLAPLRRNGHIVGGLLRFRIKTKGPHFF
jgi:hypothetical protein